MDIFNIVGTVAIKVADAFDSLDQTVDKAEATENKVSSAFRKIGQAAVTHMKTDKPKQFGDSLADITAIANTQEAELAKLKVKYQDLYLSLGKNHIKTEECAKEIEELSAELKENRGRLEEAREAADNLGNSVEEAGEDSERASGQISSAFSTIGSVALKMGQIAATAIAAVGTAIVALGTQAVAYNASMEQYQVSFEVMTGSAEEAVGVMERLRDIGATTPFEFEDLASATQLLMNYGFTAEGAMDSMMMLGDIAQGDADKMQRVATAYGQMSSTGRVALEDVKQMIEAGFNPLQEISESTGESMESLYERISQGTISVDEITASMQRATSEGGRYFQSMERQAQTVSGLLSTLKDNFQQFTGTVFSGLSESIGGTVLPMAIEYIEELSTIYEEEGIEGMLAATGNILAEIIDFIVGNAPMVIGMAVGIIESFASGIIANSESIISGLLSVCGILISSILEMAPQFLQLGVDLLLQLVLGIASGLPEAIPTIASVAIQMVQILTENAPLFTSAAVQLIQGLITGCMTALPMVLQYIPTWLETIASAWLDNISILTGCLSFVMESIAENLPIFLDIIIAMLPVCFEILADTIVSAVPVFIQAALDLTIALCEALPEICQALFDAIPLIVEGILLGLFNLGARIRTEILDPAISVFVEWLNNIRTRLTNAVNTAKEFLVSGFNAAKDALAEIADGIASKFEAAFNSLVGIVREPLNSIIGFVNQVIDALNSISIDIPDWVPEYGGQTFGINIPNISYLAKGGVITEPALLGYNPLSGRGVVAGEAGDEAIAPIGVLQAYIEEAVARQNYALVAVLERILEAIIALDANMGGNLSEALEGLTFSADKREFARLVKAVN